MTEIGSQSATWHAPAPDDATPSPSRSPGTW